MNGSTSKISEFVDFHLQLIVTGIPFFVLDIKPFLNKIKTINIVLEETYLVTMDVKSLYFRIFNLKGIAAAKKALSKESNKTVPTKFITTFLTLILTLNNFVFNCKQFHQIIGCVMATICAPAYANIFMAETCQCYTFDTLPIYSAYGNAIN